MDNNNVKIVRDGLALFFTNLTKGSLKDLYLNNARIDIECASVLNSILSGMPKFEVLCLSSSLSKDLIAKVLFDGLKVPKLKWLELS